MKPLWDSALAVRKKQLPTNPCHGGSHFWLNRSGIPGQGVFRYHRTAPYMEPMTTDAMSASTIPNAR